MSNIEITLTISLPDNHKGDNLVECILFLRILASKYPEHLTIAYEALEREYRLPPMEQLMAEQS